MKSVHLDCPGWAHRSVSLGAQGKQLVFVTNNSTKSRKGYLSKFTNLGLNVAGQRRSTAPPTRPPPT